MLRERLDSFLPVRKGERRLSLAERKLLLGGPFCDDTSPLIGVMATRIAARTWKVEKVRMEDWQEGDESEPMPIHTSVHIAFCSENRISGEITPQIVSLCNSEDNWPAIARARRVEDTARQIIGSVKIGSVAKVTVSAAKKVLFSK